MDEFNEGELREMAGQLGGTESAKQFVARFNGLIRGGCDHIGDYWISESERHRRLKKIRKAVESLLPLLKPLCFEEGLDLSVMPADVATAMLIRGALSARGTENLLAKFDREQVPQEQRGSLHLEYLRSLPVNSVTPLVARLEEFREAVARAESKVKPKRGNSQGRGRRADGLYSKNLRKRYLAKNFVFWYRAFFGHFPPLTGDGPVYDVLKRVFERAGLADKESYHSFRSAIGENKVRFKDSHQTTMELAPRRPTKYRKRGLVVVK